MPVQRLDHSFKTVEPAGALVRRPFDHPQVQVLEIGFRAARNLNAVCHACGAIGQTPAAPASYGRAGFEAQGRAYLEFALGNPSHYRVMFGGVLDRQTPDPGLAEEAGGAFQALVDALVDQQRAGLVRDGDPRRLALFVWAAVHGLAMLAIDGQLPPDQDMANLTRDALERISAGIARPVPQGECRRAPCTGR